LFLRSAEYAVYYEKLLKNFGGDQIRRGIRVLFYLHLSNLFFMQVS